MLDQIKRYSEKLAADRSADPSAIAFAVRDDIISSSGNHELSRLAAEILAGTNCLAVCVARPALPFADWLLRRAEPDDRTIVPRDTETRTFLHDIPIIRSGTLNSVPAMTIARLLGERKGVIVEGLGIIANGALTVEQAYINWSSIFHSTFVKYLEDILDCGFIFPQESDDFSRFRTEWLQPLNCDGLLFRDGPLDSKEIILDELCRVGRYTVERGLVDSFFGNISCFYDGITYISQTASSLDALEGCIDPVPFANTSTVGITASSELVAHRSIYEKTGCTAILHGHPRFAVIMSMRCADQNSCPVADCWRDCPHTRYIGATPVVAGEIGAGGLARRVPPVIAEHGDAIVYGHGVFTIGRSGFREAFQKMVDVENQCRREYFAILDSATGSSD